MVVLAAGRRHPVACRAEGTAVAAGNGQAGECDGASSSDVVAMAAGNVHAAPNTGRSHTVGLRSDGSVMATGWNGDGQCVVHEWRDVTAIAAGWRRTLGIRTDGTVLASGRNDEGHCDVAAWSAMVLVACGDWHSTICLQRRLRTAGRQASQLADR